ncbi:hypothetical protein [Arthrobacter alpinus]|uniref:hypothetical protein n=1 Tax=Arthrobacter alpinus TaxID=656366 RepID=UPI000944DDB4|nr:hypothetical protein [Arthrobacter alpinus]
MATTGGRAELGKTALGLGERPPQTQFHNDFKPFSFLLLQVAVVLATLVFIAHTLPELLPSSGAVDRG